MTGRASDFGNWTAAGRRLRRFARKSEFVRGQLARSPVSASQAASDPQAWRLLRPIGKHDFIADQRSSPPFGSRRCVPISEISLVVESSGSTGEGRETHYLSRRDFTRLREMQARYLGGMGIGAEDIVALTLPVGMAGGGLKIMEAAAHLGAKVLRVANLSAKQKLEAMRDYRASVVVGTPFYVDRLRQAAEESEINLSQIDVRRILVATQSVSLDWIHSVQEQWGARLYEWYGMSAGLVAFCCREGMVTPNGERGTLHWEPDFAFHEVVDLTTGEWVDRDARGELIGTVLQADAEPVFRIASGDEVQFRPPGTCGCGSDQPGFESGTVRRLDQMLKVKGVNLWPSHVEAIIFQLDGVRDYRARLFQDAAQREVIHIEVLASSSNPGLAGRLQETLRDATGLSFEITVVENGIQWTQETIGEAAKTQRWLDQRGSK